MAPLDARAYIKILFGKKLSIAEIKAELDRTFGTDSPGIPTIKNGIMVLSVAVSPLQMLPEVAILWKWTMSGLWPRLRL